MDPTNPRLMDPGFRVIMDEKLDFYIVNVNPKATYDAWGPDFAENLRNRIRTAPKTGIYGVLWNPRHRPFYLGMDKTPAKFEFPLEALDAFKHMKHEIGVFLE